MGNHKNFFFSKQKTLFFSNTNHGRDRSQDRSDSASCFQPRWRRVRLPHQAHHRAQEADGRLLRPPRPDAQRYSLPLRRPAHHGHRHAQRPRDGGRRHDRRHAAADRWCLLVLNTLEQTRSYFSLSFSAIISHITLSFPQQQHQKKKSNNAPHHPCLFFLFFFSLSPGSFFSFIVAPGPIHVVDTLAASIYFFFLCSPIAFILNATKCNEKKPFSA